MPTEKITIATYDGPCATEVCTPDGQGPWPSVILLHDAGGPRPAMVAIAQRIAAMGYAVFAPDMFHRQPPLSHAFFDGRPVTVDEVVGLFDDPVKGPQFTELYRVPAFDYKNLETTISAVLATIAERTDVTESVGTTGYCMGGNMSLRIATIFGARIAATAAFHPGRLVIATPDSPHLRVSSIRSQVYIAAASNDASLTDADKQALGTALTAAGVAHEIETYPGKHGFAVSDHTSAYDAACAERHYAAIQRLFAATLT